MGEKVMVDGMVCRIVKTFQFENNDYVYLAKWEDDDITGDFYIYKKDLASQKYVKVEDSEELKRVLLVVVSELS